MSSTAFRGYTKARQLMMATHELGHAEQWAEALRQNAGDVAATLSQHYGFPFGFSESPASFKIEFAEQEIDTETRAMERVGKYLGGLPPEEVRFSQKAIENQQQIIKEQQQKQKR
jgi:hypothetical protein